jgi:Ca2+-binding RTX toxin-like protein
MPNVTVAGAHGLVTVPFHSAYNAMLAQQLADVITAGVNNSSIIPADNADGPPPAVSDGKTGEFVVSKSNIPTILPSTYSALVVTAQTASVIDNAPTGQGVIAGEGNLTLMVASGSGSIFAGGGDNLISLLSSDTTGGGWTIYTDKGDDRIIAQNPGSDSISAGLGNNNIQLGSGQYYITTTGTDSILGGSGSETVQAAGNGSDLISGGASDLFFVGAAGGATIYGGSGSDTVFGGSGSTFAVGGTAGNNYMVAGTGLATLFGGGSGDQLYASGSEAQLLAAAGGNETLNAGGSSGPVTLVAGSGTDQISTGIGADTVVGGAGTASINAALGTDVFQFINGQAGGTDVVTGIYSSQNVSINLQNYGPGEVASAVAGQTTTGSGISGTVTLTLSDNTQITFDGFSTKLTAGNFTT